MKFKNRNINKRFTTLDNPKEYVVTYKNHKSSHESVEMAKKYINDCIRFERERKKILFSIQEDEKNV
tara:strand:- start:198 stop:398 length:201 start_codon:yes stop_codon:yes gene_type:complete